MTAKYNLAKVLPIIAILAMIFSSIQPPAAQAQGGDGLQRQVNAESGRVSFISPASGPSLSAARALGQQAIRSQDPAMALAYRYAPEFGLRDAERSLTAMESNRSEAGHITARFQQNYQDVPVMGGELIVNTNDDGDLYSISGEVSPGLSLSTEPTIAPEQARQTALGAMAKWYEKTPEDFTATEPELWIYDESLLQPSTRPVELTWRMEVTPKEAGMPVRELVLVNAQRGNVSLHFNQVDTAWTANEQTDDVPTPAPEPQQLTKSSFPTMIPDPVVTAQPSQEKRSGREMPKLEPMTSSSFETTGATWYVAATGSDLNSCTTESEPCATINAAINKAVSDDTIKIATGTYTGTGTEAVLANQNLTFSGGWDTSFVIQDGYSTIDGQNERMGVVLEGGANAIIERFKVQNGNASYPWATGAIHITNGTLTCNYCIIGDNLNNYSIYNSANNTLTLNNSMIINNRGTGIGNAGILVINNSAVIGNKNGGIYNEGWYGINGKATLNNTTLGGNSSPRWYGGGLVNNGYGTVILNNSTVSHNSATDGGGIYNGPYGSTVTLKNTIVANNTGNFSGPDCRGQIISSGFNLIGDTTSCTFAASTGDLLNVVSKLGELIGSPAYYPLLSDSPAINAGNPAIPASENNACLADDERGIARPVGARCDIGAYEYAVPDIVTRILIYSGDGQHAAPRATFPNPLRVSAIDDQGSPVPGVDITFTAPDSGASGSFTGTGSRTTTVKTNLNGIANAPTFAANAEVGSYSVVASAGGVESVNFTLHNLFWFVATTGSNSNDCRTPSTPCATIGGPVGKVGFFGGDTVLVGSGVYTGSGDQVLLIDKNVNLSGGWDSMFSTQSGFSTIDGQNSRRGIYVNANVTAALDHFTVQNGLATNFGGGIHNEGTLRLDYLSIQNNQVSAGGGGGIDTAGTTMINHSTVTNNTASGAAGIGNSGALTIVNSTISNNQAKSGDGGGINSFIGHVEISNTTISNNSARGNGGAIYLYYGDVSLASVTINGNTATNYGGGIYGGHAYLQNSILAGNTTTNGYNMECSTVITSGGHNLVGNDTGCPISFAEGDQRGTTATPLFPRLGPLQDNGGPTLTQALLQGSPAIDKGNPVVPGSTRTACLATDQRGVSRPAGSRCDIGAYEGSVSWTPSPLVETYNANKSYTLPGTFLCNEADPDCTNGDAHAKAAHQFAVGVYNFYASKHSRASIDNNGMTIKSSVHYCSQYYGCPYANAFWNDKQMVYGDKYDYPLADDVVAHELTHGVTQYESNLFYYYQSGAINESFSDLWGEYYDQRNGLGNDAANVRWIIGEDTGGYPIATGFSVPAIRSMSNPPALADPDRMSSPNYYKGQDDSGGVHHNSGVNNKAVFLMVDGGTFYGWTVNPLGWEKVAAIYYEVNTSYMTSGADYSDLYYALQLACTSLVGQKGIVASDCTRVKDALDAVEMNSQPTTNFNTDVSYCGGPKPTILFTDDLEGGGNGAWGYSTSYGKNRWRLDSPYGSYAHSGVHMMYADDYPAAKTDTRLELDLNVTPRTGIFIPSHAYMRFSHAFGFDDENGINYDGGVLEWRGTGTTYTPDWKDAGSMIINNGYNGTIVTGYGNPLAGKKAFVNDSHGYISSRLDLAALANKYVMFGWRMGLDYDIVDWGWWLDDIEIYTCPPSTFADVPITHPYHEDIEILYANGLTGGCSTSPMKFCPDQIMDRAQASVFMMRGTYGSGYFPNPTANLFQDSWTPGTWARPWVEAMRETGLTTGCQLTPWMYCPWKRLPREQVVIFGLKMKYGNGYLPPAATGTVFADMTDPNYYATSWAEKAYADGLIQACGTLNGKPKFCPATLVTRGLGAYVIVRAKNLTMP